jgi:valyl-tRNA synthetase
LGTWNDHASIATEAKEVVAKLKSEGIKADLTREEFLKHAYDWTDKYGGVILEQLKLLPVTGSVPSLPWILTCQHL